MVASDNRNTGQSNYVLHDFPSCEQHNIQKDRRKKGEITHQYKMLFLLLMLYLHIHKSHASETGSLGASRWRQPFFFLSKTLNILFC
jgi:hypothetical protein